MAKVLFVARKSEGINTGASIITDRNLELLRQVHGESNVECYWIEQEFSRTNLFLNVLQLNMSGLNNRHVEKVFTIIHSGDFTEVFIDNSLLAKLTKAIKQEFPLIKVFLFFHNVEYDYFFKLMKSSKRIWHLLSIIAVKHNEQIGCDFADELIFLNNRDANRVIELYGLAVNKSYRILPTSMKDRFKHGLSIKGESKERLILLFVGTLFFSNYHGIKWFVEQVMPFVNADLLIVGRGFEAVADKLTAPNVIVIGTVEDIDAYYYKADVIIAPIFQGSGMKTKLTEALMFGKQIIGTQEAFEGYDLDISSIGFLCNTANDFIETLRGNKFNKFHFKSRESFSYNYDSSISLDKLLTKPLKVIKNRRMVFAELARTGLVHNGINSSLVKVFKEYYQIPSVEFWGEREHLNNLSLDNTRTFPIKVYNEKQANKRFKSIQLILREFGFVIGWIKLLVYVRRKKVDVLVITSILPFVHLIMKYTIKLIHKNTKVYAVLHGEVENIESHKNSYYNSLKRAINVDSKLKSRFKYIVLSDAIRTNLLNSFDVSENSVLAIPHPYQFNNTTFGHKIVQKKTIIMGAIGVQTTTIKQSHLIFKLASLFEEQIKQGLVEFRIIGKLENNMSTYINPLVNIFTENNGMLGRLSFDNEISKLDYVLFFAPKGAYKFIASGTVLDALQYQIPIVGLSNDNLNELFEKAGQIGYLADDFKTMVSLIESLINHPNDEVYNTIRKNMLDAQSLFSIENAVKDLKLQD